ncbi:MAG: Gfo/Idh/MocA family oxidoreductase [Firmicutes bacterium]|jgi:predicted dehydrogenase|nr:Gfo/Idh/MocA family oxidoreductase [Bacillota bacterium]
MDKLRIGMIGVRGRGGIARHWQASKRAVVVAGADVNEDHLQAFREEINPDAFITTDYREMLERDDVDAVAITSPDFVHEEHAVAALEAGKHVFCEKPLAITTEGCDRILRTWKASGKRLMVGFNMRYMPVFRVMKEIVDSGAIGEIKAVWVRHFVGAGGDFYYHDWHGTRENVTGLLLQKGSHDIDMIHWITGQYTKGVVAFGSLDYFGGDKPNDLTCDTCPEVDTCTEAQPHSRRRQCAFRQEIDVEDHSMVLMDMEGGIKASYLQCHYAPDYYRNYVFIGTEGRMESLDNGTVEVKTRRSNTWREHADRVYRVKGAAGGHGGADPLICAEFVEMVLDGKEPLATPEAGRMSVAVGCAATESLRNGGQPVDIPPIAW